MRPETFLKLTETKTHTTVHPILALSIVAFWAGLAGLVFYLNTQSQDFQLRQYVASEVKAAAEDATNSIRLNWTAPGDDGNSGQASTYEIRYSTTPLNETSWNFATQLSSPPKPKPAGQSESFLVTQLQPNQTYYFGLKTLDEAGNTSAISNIATKKTSAVSFPNCVENWNCNAWSACESGQQTRSCADQSACGTQTNKPAESQSCPASTNQTTDSVPPNSVITAAPTTTQITPTFTFTWSGLDDTTSTNNLKFSYKLDNRAWSSWNTQTSLTVDNLKNGQHVFQVRSQDQAGNIDPSPASATFQVRLNSFLAVGVQKGGQPKVRTYNFNGVLLNQFSAFESAYRGGIQVTVGDLGQDGHSEIVVSSNSGHRGEVKIFRPDGSLITNFLPYGMSYRDGLNLAIADINGDGLAEIITAKQKGLPNVRVFGYRLNRYTQVYKEFNAESVNYRSGISLAAGDINGDGRDEIITAPAGSGSNALRVFRLQGNTIRQVAAKSKILDSANSGIAIATGDLSGDGSAEIIVGPQKNYAPIIRIFTLRGTNIVKLRRDYRAFRTVDRAGIRLSTADFNFDGKADFFISYGDIVQPKITVFSGSNFVKLKTLNVFSSRDRLILSHSSGV